MNAFMARVLHIILAFAVLFSSTGFAVNTHYCGGRPKHKAIFFEAERCSPAEKAPKKAGVHCAAGAHLTKKRCCHDGFEFHKLKQDRKTTGVEGLSLKPAPVAGIIPSLPHFLPFVPQAPRFTLLRYKPPPLSGANTPARLQVFRL